MTSYPVSRLVQKVRAKLGDSRSNRSRDIRLAHFVRDDERHRRTTVIIQEAKSLLTFCLKIIFVTAMASAASGIDDSIKRKGIRVSHKNENKVVTTMVIWPLDDRTYCVRSAFSHLGLCSPHHFQTSRCLLGHRWHSRGGLLPSLCLSICLPRCVLWLNGARYAYSLCGNRIGMWVEISVGTIFDPT